MLQKKLKVPHIWSYFEFGHEKGEHDGAGACIKRELCRQEINFTTNSLIRYEKSIVEWCSLVMGEGTGTCEDKSHKKGHVHRYFWKVVDVDRSSGMNEKQSKALMDSIQLEHHTMQYLKYI
jgi:hypothetical protein